MQLRREQQLLLPFLVSSLGASMSKIPFWVSVLDRVTPQFRNVVSARVRPFMVRTVDNFIKSPSWQWYVQHLTARPIMVKSVTTSLAYGTSNVLVQTYEVASGKKEHFSVRHMLANFAVGAMNGIACHYWYNNLDMFIVRGVHAFHKIKLKGMHHLAGNLGMLKHPTFADIYNETLKTQATPRMLGKWSNLAAKLVVDEFLFSLAWLMFYYGATTMMVGGTVEKAVSTIRQNLIDGFKADAAIFLPLQIMNLKVVPPLFQPLVVTVGNFFFSTALNLIGHEAHATDGEVCSCCGQVIRSSPGEDKH